MTVPAQAALFGPQPLAHLRLQRQLSEGRRRPPTPGRAGPTRHPDQRAHGAALTARMLALRAIHAKRVRVLGVDPDLVLVLHVNAIPRLESLRHAGLELVDVLPGKKVVVSAGTDTEMRSLAAMLAEYQAGPPLKLSPVPEATAEPTTPNSGESDRLQRPGTAKHQALFDCIDTMDAFGPQDVLTDDLAAHLASIGDAEPVRVDAQLWCPELEAEARSMADAVVEAIDGARNGTVLDRTIRPTAGLSLVRFDAPAETVRLVASLRGVRRLDLLPRATLTYAQSVGLGSTALPPVVPPGPEAPIFAVIDSGIRSGHPLIGPAVRDAIALPPHVDGSDGNGHGTRVASLALYGALEPLLASGDPFRAAGWLVSIRVLDDDARFPDDSLWERQLLEALEVAADAGARIVNLSLGDERRPYQPDRPTPLAAAIDEFVRRRRVVVVVSVGNYPLSSYPVNNATAEAYLTHQLADASAGVLDPATSALSLTVGALCADDESGYRLVRERVDTVPVGGQDWPSPLTRLGPGAARMIKPELAMPGGGATSDTMTGRLTATAGVIAADASRPDRLFCVDTGTSYAAPLSTHCALRALAANPGLSADGIRALVLASTYPDLAADIFEDGKGTAAHRDQRQRLAGYGRPDADRAASSSDHRALLLAEESLPLDNVHLYRVPIPTTFFDPGGWRRLTVALAFSPLTRSTRIDYLGSRMSLEVYRGVSIEDVERAYLALDIGENEDPDAETLGPSGLAPHAITFEPGSRRRSAGANQAATKVFAQRLDPDNGLDLVVAVRNTNRWSAPAGREPYAIAVVLQRDDGHRPLYVELRAALEQQLLSTVRQEVTATVQEIELGR